MPKPAANSNMLSRPTGEDRRRWIRYPVRLSIKCRLAGCAQESPWSAQVQNISHGGIKIFCRHLVTPGATILISPPYPKLLPQLARVIHVSDGSDGNKIVGCAFPQELLDEEELLTWVKNQNGR
jgi:hypothetical protein